MPHPGMWRDGPRHGQLCDPQEVTFWYYFLVNFQYDTVVFWYFWNCIRRNHLHRREFLNIIFVIFSVSHNGVFSFFLKWIHIHKLILRQFSSLAFFALISSFWVISNFSFHVVAVFAYIFSSKSIIHRTMLTWYTKKMQFHFW